MDDKDCLAVTFALIGKVVHKGHQANTYMAHLTDSFYLEQSMDFHIEYVKSLG